MNILILVLFYYLNGMIGTCPNFIERHGISGWTLPTGWHIEGDLPNQAAIITPYTAWVIVYQ